MEDVFSVAEDIASFVKGIECGSWKDEYSLVVVYLTYLRLSMASSHLEKARIEMHIQWLVGCEARRGVDWGGGQRCGGRTRGLVELDWISWLSTF